MKTKIRRTAALGASVAVGAALLVAGANTASAAVVGTLTGPTSASTIDPFAVRTSAVCPAGQGSNSLVGYIDGPGLWSNIVGVSISTSQFGNETTAVQASGSLVGIASGSGVAGLAVVDGTYTFTLKCTDDIGFTDGGTFVGTFSVTGNTFGFTAPAAPASTTTLAVTPASPATIGSPVTLTANVTSTAAVAGAVQFKDGTTNLGAPVAVANGAAALTSSALTGGAHSLSAVFVPTNTSATAASTSNVVAYTINAPAAATTTTLSSSPAAPTTADVVSLTAAVTPANAVGTVTFKEGSTTVGTSAVSGGGASVSLTGLSAGPHSYTAQFTPSNAATFLASTSTAYNVTVTTFAGVQDSENITTTIAAGTLTITAGGPTVDLGALALNSSNTLLVQGAAKDINPVTVTDTRAGGLGWNVNGVVGDFVSGSGDKINSENLGWFPQIVSQQSVQNVTKGPDVAPGAGVAVGASTGAGLKTPHLLASAAAGASVGTAVVSAKLALQAPTSTKAGVYNSTLTLTAI